MKKAENVAPYHSNSDTMHLCKPAELRRSQSS